MKNILVLCCVVFWHLSVRAESQFRVDLVGSGRADVFVDRSWRNGADAIEAKVSVSPEASAAGVSLKAYFFAGDGKLIHTADKPSEVNAGNGGTVPFPVTFNAGKKYSFFFGIPQMIQSGAGKWKRVIVVFGQGSDLSAKVYPKDDLKKFSFPGKDMVKQ